MKSFKKLANFKNFEILFSKNCNREIFHALIISPPPVCPPPLLPLCCCNHHTGFQSGLQAVQLHDTSQRTFPRGLSSQYAVVQRNQINNSTAPWLLALSRPTFKIISWCKSKERNNVWFSSFATIISNYATTLAQQHDLALSQQ